MCNSILNIGLHFLYPLLRGLMLALCNLFSVSLAPDPSSVTSSVSINGPGTSERSLPKEWNVLGGFNNKRLCLPLGLGVWVKPEGHHSHWVRWLLAWVCENHWCYSFSLSAPLVEGNWGVEGAFLDSSKVRIVWLMWTVLLCGPWGYSCLKKEEGGSLNQKHLNLQVIYMHSFSDSQSFKL